VARGVDNRAMDHDAPPAGSTATSTGPQLEPTPATIACGCNKTIHDETVLQEPHYGFFANMFLLFGVTAAPKRVDYICLTCNKTIASTADSASLRKATH
jgi:hypothetical protein